MSYQEPKVEVVMKSISKRDLALLEAKAHSACRIVESCNESKEFPDWSPEMSEARERLFVSACRFLEFQFTDGKDDDEPEEPDDEDPEPPNKMRTHLDKLG